VDKRGQPEQGIDVIISQKRKIDKEGHKRGMVAVCGEYNNRTSLLKVQYVRIL